MADRNSSGLAGPAVLITLLAALGIGGTVRRPTAPSNAPPPIGSALPSAPAESVGLAGSYEKNGGYEHGAGYLLQRFFSRLDDDVEDKKAWATYHKSNSPSGASDSFGAEFFNEDPRHNYSIRFLIATLPAPISPPLQYMFDSELEALQSAVGTAGYSLDSFDLPWTNGGKDSAGKFQLAGEIDIDPAESPSPTPSPTPSGTKSTHQSAKAKLKRSQDEIDKNSKTSYTLKPNSEGESHWKRDSGVVLFRNGTQLLVVFLVGEAPTRGVNRMALRDALDQIAWLERWKDPPEDRRPPPDLSNRFAPSSKPTVQQIRIVGPTFSGSTASLRNTLEDFRDTSIKWGPGARIQIISGTATSVKAQELSDSDANPPTISFNTVQIPDAVLWDQIPQILDNVADVTALPVGNSSPRIALLSEGDTIYGNKARGDADVLQLKFPLHISQLRSAQTSSSRVGIGPDLERHDPALPDEAGQQRRDVIQQFSPRAAVYDELFLSNLLVTIKREHIRYVGIVATDVEDLIFLVQQIRIYCPDTVVFTTSADIAFLHSDVNADLRGMLVFTTYPLFNQLQKWTFPFDGDAVRETFLNDLAHGVYNATLAQLDRPDKMLDYGQPFVARPRSPVIQIGVVGRDDIWPVAFQFPKLEESDAVLPPNSGSRRRGANCEAYLPVGEWVPPGVIARVYPPTFEFLFLVLNIAFLVGALILLIGEGYLWLDWSAQTCGTRSFLLKRRLEQLVRERWWLSSLLLMDSSACRFHNQRRVYLMFFAIGMLLAEIVGLGFALLPVVVVMRSGRDYPTVLSLFTHFQWKVLFSFGSFRGIAFSFEILAAIVVLVAAIVTTFRMVGSFEVTSSTAWWWVLLAACPLVLSSCFIGHLWIRPPVAFGLYAFLRATHLHSGVSPLMALIFLGSAGFTLIGGGTWRVMMLEDRPLPQPFLSALGETASFRGVAVLWTRVVDLLEHPAKEVILAASVLVLSLGLAFIYFGLRKIGSAYSIDGEQFDILFILLAFGIYSMFSLALLRFAFAWYALRHLLRRLYFHPSRDSYKNLQLAAKPTRLDLKQIRLYEARPGLTAIEYGLGRARAIIRIAREADDVKRPILDLVSDIVNRKDLETTLVNAETQLEAVLKDSNWAANVAARRTLYATMIDLSSIVVSLFEPVWRMSARQPPLLPLRVTVNSVEDKPTVDRVLLEQAELFVAARVADFARHVFPLLINLVGFAMPAVLAMMLALSVYPFPAHDTLLWVGWTVLLTAIAVSLCVFVSINRNPIISMISGSDPGQFNWDSTFTVHFLLFAVFPILTILGAQFPHALTGIFSWVGSIFGGGGNG